LKYLNPVYKRGVIPDSDEPMALCLPSNKINTYLANISNIYLPENGSSYGTFASNDISSDPHSDDLVRKYHKVKRGEHLQSIARRYNCTVSDLKNWNGLKGNNLVTGQKLSVYVPAHKKNDKVAVKQTTEKSTPATAAASKIKSNSLPVIKGDMKFAWHTVQPGDSLWKIAQRYEGMTVEQIKELNNLQSNELKVGTKLKVVVNG
jgi:membrane-bound lytic murein transglycosylase D